MNKTIKRGTKVLVRDGFDEQWQEREYDYFREGVPYPHYVIGGGRYSCNMWAMAKVIEDNSMLRRGEMIEVQDRGDTEWQQRRFIRRDSGYTVCEQPGDRRKEIFWERGRASHSDLLASQIEVMEAYKNGADIQFRTKTDGCNDNWGPAATPTWCWSKRDYRVKPREVTYTVSFDQGWEINVSNLTGTLELMAKGDFETVTVTKHT